MKDQGERSPQTFLVNNFPSLSSTATKARRSVHFLVSFAAARTVFEEYH